MEPQDNKAWSKAWGEAFEGASIAPSEASWSAIEAEITPQKPSYRAFWWVAASFLAGVASTAGVFLWWNSHTEPMPVVALEQSRMLDDDAVLLGENKIQKGKEKRKLQDVTEETLIGEVEQAARADDTSTQAQWAENKQTMIAQTANQAPVPSMASSTNTLAYQWKSLSPQGPTLQFMKEVRWQLFNDRPVQWYKDEVLLAEEEEESSLVQPWRMGLALASGAMNGGIGSASNLEADMAFDPAGAMSYGFVESEDKGITTSYGAQVGKRVGKRWVLSSGLGYSVSSHKSSSNLILVDQGSSVKLNAVNEFVDTDAQQARFGLESYQLEVSSEVYQLRNQYEFISVPIQVGYYLVDTKWKVAVSTGLMADIFYRYTTTEESGALQDLVLRPKDSPEWNWLNTSLSTGMEISRELGGNYLLSVQPSYRLVLNQEGAFATNSLSPNVFQLGFSFQYIFQ
ncbi:hypothetical protein QWY31_10040 [Cytophagales bacterium LB-30]|uniref:Outer membrane protein beta-barrel domain-containing protein n=1 Tax=Shiella aurantiaca TaxID=3058365 RepID=A0ABT8F628_9BACT|nr:hypothetical protein [Shiella aurantiaca]MDN4165845.1 hypothetical protein [Shiella aurantiaca]